MPILGSSNSAANKNMMSKIWTNTVQLSDWVEIIVGKGEIARYEQFLLFPQYFQKLSFVDASKWVFMEWRVKRYAGIRSEYTYITEMHNFETWLFPKRTILEASKLKEFANHYFKLDENGRKFSKWVENTVGKVRNCSHSVFKRLVLQTRKNQGLFGKGTICIILCCKVKCTPSK